MRRLIDAPRTGLLPRLKMAGTAQALARFLANVTRHGFGKVRIAGQTGYNALGNAPPVRSRNHQRYVSCFRRQAIAAITAPFGAIASWALRRLQLTAMMYHCALTRRTLRPLELALVTRSAILLPLVNSLGFGDVPAATIAATAT